MSDNEEFDFKSFGENLGEFSTKLGEIFEKLGTAIDEDIGEKVSEQFIESFGKISEEQKEQIEEGAQLMKGFTNSIKSALDDMTSQITFENNEKDNSECPIKKCPAFKGCSVSNNRGECPMKNCPAFKGCPILSGNNDMDRLVAQYRVIQNKINSFDQDQTKEFWGKYYGITLESEDISRLEEKIDDITITLTTLQNKA